MRLGGIILLFPPQTDGRSKNRPAPLLKRLPSFGGWLVGRISRQLQPAAPGFDEVVTRNDGAFGESGLGVDSVIRAGFLAIVPAKTSWVPLEQSHPSDTAACSVA
jgi:mRNA interferase MazF